MAPSISQGLNREPLLVVHDIQKSFISAARKEEVIALNKLNLEVYAGDFVCIVGPSGCGKSTTLRLIAGLEHASSGQILLRNEAICGPGADRCMVFQHYTLFPWRTVKRNLAFGLEIKKVNRKQQEQIISQYLEMIQLEDFQNKYPFELSGGMQQKVAIASALCNDPKVLLMDEPFGALDAQTRLKMQMDLIRIWAKTKKTIVFVTHAVDEAITLGTMVAVMTRRPGSIKEVIPIDFSHPRDPTSKEFNDMRGRIMDCLKEEIEDQFVVTIQEM